MNTAVIITTYNWPRALHLVLASVARQTHLPSEVIVADDGSSAGTRATVEKWSSHLPIKHVWVPDRSFRAARVRNLAILKSSADHLILVDGDCILPPNFVSAHRTLVGGRHLVAGGRFLMSEAETKKVISPHSKKTVPAFLGWKFKSIPLGILRDLRPRNWSQVRTCNLSLMRDDLFQVGGFDEAYIGWGREDSDLVIRLIRSGVAVRSGRLAACVKHLHHGEGTKSKLGFNEAQFEILRDRVTQVLPERSSLEN